MTQSETILIVVDPTAETQPAVERGMRVARAAGLSVELFICDYRPQLVGSTLLRPERLEQAKRGYLGERDRLLADVAERYAVDGVDVKISTAWDHPLYEGVIRQVLRSDPRMVIKDTHFHSAVNRAFFSNTDWHLIRSCPAPLWLVRREASFEAPVVLAAVDPMHEHDKPAELDGRLLSEAFELAAELGGVVHVFHAFNPFVDPDDPKRIEDAHDAGMRKLADSFQIPSDRVHVHAGNVTDVLPHVATEIGASLVVMGAVSRARLEQAIVGSTAENVLDSLPCDVLIVKPKGFISPVTFKSAPKGVIYADEQG